VRQLAFPLDNQPDGLRRKFVDMDREGLGRIASAATASPADWRASAVAVAAHVGKTAPEYAAIQRFWLSAAFCDAFDQ
jgi:hypothetical protein